MKQLTRTDYQTVLPAQQKVPNTEWHIEQARKFTCGFACSEDQLQRLSPLWFPSAPHTHPVALFQGLYRDDELLCVNTGRKLLGSGTTMEAGQWIDIFCEYGSPTGETGAWFRLNPVKGDEGSGYNGAHTANDVASFRYLLLESDKLPTDLQLGVMVKLPLPISAIFSVGKSVHALVKLGCHDIENYGEQTRIITNKLAHMGFAPSNPSRYTRLPGSTRGDAVQRLLYLNRNPKPGQTIWE